MEWLIYNLIWIIECIVILLCFHTVNGEKMQYNRKTLIMIIINNIMYNLFFLGMIPKLCADVVVMASMIVYSFRGFRKKVWETLLRCLGGMLLAAVIEIEAILLVSFVETFLDTAVFIALINSIIMFIIGYFINRFYFEMNKKVYYSKKDKVMVCAWFICIVFICEIIDDFISYKRMHQVLTFAALLFIVFIYGLLLVLKKRRWELEVKNSEMEMHQVYEKHYKELVKEVRTRQHDYKNQLTAIYCVKQRIDDSEQLSSYTEEIADKFKYEHLLTYCNNSILAGFLYNKCLIFEKEGISIKYEINVDKADCVMLLHEIVEILGILLDNAFEYLQSNNQFQPYILLKLKEERDHLLIEVSNRAVYLDNIGIEEMFKEGYSSKGSNRGIGLYRLKQLTDKYKAELCVQNINKEDNNWLSFRIIIGS